MGMCLNSHLKMGQQYIEGKGGCTSFSDNKIYRAKFEKIDTIGNINMADSGYNISVLLQPPIQANFDIGYPNFPEYIGTYYTGKA